MHQTTVSDACAALSPSSPAPAAIEVQTVANLAPNMLATSLRAAGVPIPFFDVTAGAFTADHTGFDQAIDHATVSGGTVVITDGTTMQTATITPPQAASSR